MKSREQGYTVAEMLTVVTIVGLLTLVSVPSFITFRNSGKMRNSVRTFTTDVRAARQRAITRSRQVMVTYGTTPAGTPMANYQRSYYIYDGDLPSGSTNWTPVDRTMSGVGTTAALHELDDVVYFPANAASTPQTFDDTFRCSLGACSTGTDNRPEVIFFPDGHVRVPSGATMGQITLTTAMNIPTKTYVIQISPTGAVKAVGQ
jgi:Tfp pilus assembly protein FimT